MYPSFILGVFINKYFKIFQKNSKKIMTVTGILFIIMIQYWTEFFWEIFPVKNIDNTLIYHNIIILIYQKSYKFILGFSASLFFLSLFEYMSHKLKSNRFGDLCFKWGSLTLGIYIIHSLLIEMFITSIPKLDDCNIYVYSFLITPIISLILILISILLIEIIKLNKYIYLFLLGSKLSSLPELNKKIFRFIVRT